MARRKKIIYGLVAAMMFALLAATFLLYTLYAKPVVTPLDRAIELLNRGEYTEASALFDLAYTSQAKTVNSCILAGACKLKLGKNDDAAKLFEEAKSISPASAEATAWQAELLRLQNNPDGAVAAAAEIIAKEPKLATPHAVMGKAHYDIFEKRALECIKLLEEEPSEISARAVILIGQAKMKAAETLNVFDNNPEKRRVFKDKFEIAKAELALAEKSLAEAVARKPLFKDESLSVLLARIYVGKNEFEKAEALASKMATRGVMHVPGVLLKYDILAARGENAKNETSARDFYQKAARLLEEYIVDHPNEPLVREALYAHYVSQNMPEKAVLNAGSILSRFRQTEPRYVRGIMDLSKGDYNAAVGELMSLQEQMRNNPCYQYNLGRAHYGSGNRSTSPTQAMGAITKVVEMRPQFIPAMLMLAKLRLRDGLHKEAAVICENILKSRGRSIQINTETYVLLSESSRGLTRYEDSVHWLNLAFELDESETQVARIADVISACAPSAEQKKILPTQLCVKGLNHLRNGRSEKALESFRSAMTIDPQYIMAFVCMSKGYESIEKYEEAIKQYQDAIKLLAELIKPEDLGLHSGLARLLMKTKNYSGAEDEIRNVLKLDENNGSARLRLAAMELLKRRFTQAVGEVELAIRVEGDSAEARFILGLIHSINAQRTLAEIKTDVAERRAGERTGLTEVDIEAERRVAWDKAAASYERAAELNPELSMPFEMAAIYAGQREYLKMATLAEKSLKNATPSEKLKLIRIINAAQLGQGEFDKAIDSARSLIDEAMEQGNPREIERSKTALINSLFAARKFREAREEVTKLSADPPDFRDAYYDTIDRLSASELLIRHNTRHLFLHELVAQELAIADVYADLGVMRLPFAEQAYKNILAQDSDNRLALMQLADIYAVTNRFGMSEEMNRRILQRAPKSAMTLRNLAVIEEMRNRSDAGAETMRKAIELYQKSIEAAPDCWLPKLELAALYEQIGSVEQGKTYYGDIAALDVKSINGFKNPYSENENTLARIGQITEAVQKKKPETAFEEAFSEVLGIINEELQAKTQAPDNGVSVFRLSTDPRLLSYLTKVLVENGKPDKALKALEILLDEYPSFEGRDEAVRLRDRLKESR